MSDSLCRSCGVCPAQRLMLAKGEKGRSKGEALFATLCLAYAVADPVIVPPLVLYSDVCLARYRNSWLYVPLLHAAAGTCFLRSCFSLDPTPLRRALVQISACPSPVHSR